MTEQADKPENEKPEKKAFERIQRWKQKVIDLVIQGETPTAACRRVKPKSRRPDLIASKLKKEPLYLEALEQRLLEAVKDAGVNPSQMFLRLNQFANGDARACTWQASEAPFPEGVTVGQRKKLHELDDATARCVEPDLSSKDGEVSYRWPSRVQAARILAQALRMLTESHVIDLGEKTLAQLAAASFNRPRPPEPGEESLRQADI